MGGGRERETEKRVHTCTAKLFLSVWRILSLLLPRLRPVRLAIHHAFRLIFTKLRPPKTELALRITITITLLANKYFIHLKYPATDWRNTPIDDRSRASSGKARGDGEENTRDACARTVWPSVSDEGAAPEIHKHAYEPSTGYLKAVHCDRWGIRCIRV